MKQAHNTKEEEKTTYSCTNFNSLSDSPTFAHIHKKQPPPSTTTTTIKAIAITMAYQATDPVQRRLQVRQKAILLVKDMEDDEEWERGCWSAFKTLMPTIEGRPVLRDLSDPYFAWLLDYQIWKLFGMSSFISLSLKSFHSHINLKVN